VQRMPCSGQATDIAAALTFAVILPRVLIARHGGIKVVDRQVHGSEFRRQLRLRNCFLKKSGTIDPESFARIILADCIDPSCASENLAQSSVDRVCGYDWRRWRDQVLVKICLLQGPQQPLTDGVACQLVIAVALGAGPGQWPARIIEDEIGWPNCNVR